ncbi:fibronectin type III domain-containing protein [Candidatus Kaiserbacteria bacterium]|nr:fibronectin type III domain-containing protein [Candidatus Kaiserbacteria bacterium]
MRILFLITAFVFVSTCVPVFAAEETFIVETTVADADTTPPTAPSNLTATPISTSRIDLAWDASADDVSIAGYRVFRDAVAIATTTATSYADTGLTASTTYSYYLDAFDPTGNTSSSSVAVATTTRAETVTNTGGGGGGGNVFYLDSLEIVPNEYGVRIQYVTRSSLRGVVRWGQSAAYELGASSEETFSRTHETVLTGLLPGTRYLFSLEGVTPSGGGQVIIESSFTTNTLDDTTPPTNPRAFSGTASGTDVVLSWLNPNDSDFASVRIIRSDRFYPLDTADGWLVYEGSGTSFHDVDVLAGGTQYYAIFAYDIHGNISSGAVTAVSPEGAPSVSETPPDEEGAPYSVGPLEFSFADLIFSQDGERRFVSDDNTLVVDGGKPVTVQLPYNLAPEALKAAVFQARMQNEDGDDTLFLLRADEDKEFYTATIGPFTEAGITSAFVVMYDFLNSQVGYVRGLIDSRFVTSDGETGEVAVDAPWFTTIPIVLRLSIFVCIVVMLVIVTYSRRKASVVQM